MRKKILLTTVQNFFCIFVNFCTLVLLHSLTVSDFLLDIGTMCTTAGTI